MAATSITARQKIRKSFGQVEEIAPIPNLIELQKHSYDQFLQTGPKPKKGKKAENAETGLQGVFESVFPVKEFSGRSQLEFVDFEFGEPEYDEDECRYRGLTYAAPLRATFRLVVWDIDEDTDARSIKDIKEQEVYMGDMPIMTENGTFIINGVERVVVSQMHRSPGVFFAHDEGKSHASGKFLFSARVIPYRGSWLDFEFDAKDLMYVRIDRKRKLPITTLLMALDSDETSKLREKNKVEPFAASADLDFEVKGMSHEDILNHFYTKVTYKKDKKGWRIPFVASQWKSHKLVRDLVDAKSGKVLAEAGTKLTPRAVKKLEEQGVKEILVPADELVGHFVAKTYMAEGKKRPIATIGDEITAEIIEKLEAEKLKDVEVLNIDYVNNGPHLRNTLAIDKNNSREEALLDIYRVLRPGEPPTLESAEALFGGLFFDADRYDLSAVGRVKMNSRLGFETEDSVRVLRKEDLLEIVKILMELKDGKGVVDDIDNLANRRVRSVGELLENQYRIGLLRMERAIRERMGAVDIDTVMPHDLINAKPAAASIREFFGSSQLSQFMDQTNPLSEITHKRRLSALGPGGLTRERASFEVRDVHPTHYGRICPIETPEGPNIGLINSLSSFARVNKYGFIETPYQKVKDGKLTGEVEYLSAMNEWKHTIAQATIGLDKNNKITDEFVSCRKSGEYVIAPSAEVDYVDVSPKQLVSVAASLIPFLENDDANRALMGSNMQRQAVPLVKPVAPLVGTGMEAKVARDSGVVVIAKRDGVVDQVDATRIVIRASGGKAGETPGVDVYKMNKYQRTNHSTWMNQRPIVRVGDKIKAGDLIADGPATDDGELALGRNALVAFLSWKGYNFEDSIIISERVVSEDAFTSVHIEEFEVMARDTKLGHEDITRDIPNVGDEALRHLDETGIVAIGAEIQAGDILVGKVTPKGETLVTPEEKLLRAIFGEKASDVRDSSLRVPPGVKGTVVDVRVFSRRGVEKDERAQAIEHAEINKLGKDRDAEKQIIERSFYASLKDLLLKQEVVKGPKGVKKGAKIDEKFLEELTQAQWRTITVKDAKVMDNIEALRNQVDATISKLQKGFEDKVEKIRRGDELPPGVLKMIKVFVAVKRKLQPGDKMAGRHGNKGVVSYIAPVEDMPYLEDGTPVDIILNPLGLPSRMNVGQILETHLGWASAGLGLQVNEMLKQIKNKKASTKDLKEVLSGIYGDKYDGQIKDLKEGDLIEMAQKLKKGVPMATPVFDGAHEPEVNQELTRAGMDTSGQMTLYDGETGEPYARDVTVGQMYMLKLHHLVDDKIHARSIGPYSLVTQQPLGGKAQFGGQRFGEMEVWALEAYGAAYTLQEMLTVKSDDVSGRTKVYEAIVRGDDNFEAGIPESFNVLVKELRSLGLNTEFGNTAE